MRFEKVLRPEKISLPENIKVLESIEKGIEPELKNLAKSLRKEGFFVDDSCRIDLEEMKKLQPPLYSSQIIERHQRRSTTKREELLRNREKLIRNEEYDKLYYHLVGDIVEKLKTVSFNNFWFKNKLVALRTSLYDDYFNGIDEFILDPNPSFPRVVAAVDETSKKAAWQLKAEEMMRKLRHPDLIEIEYGALAKKSFDGLEVEYKSLKGVPIFILAFSQNEKDLLKWYGAIKEKDKKYLDQLRNEQIKKLEEQCKSFSVINGVPSKLAKQYRNLLNFLKDLENDN